MLFLSEVFFNFAPSLTVSDELILAYLPGIINTNPAKTAKQCRKAKISPHVLTTADGGVIIGALRGLFVYTIQKNGVISVKTAHTKREPMDLTQGKCWRVILLFSLPVILSYLLQQVYSISDAAIVGQTLSAAEVAGVNDTNSLVFIFLQFAFGVSAGFCVITSYYVGMHDERGVRRSLATQLLLSAALTVVLTALALVLLDPMLAWINVTPAHHEVYTAAQNGFGAANRLFNLVATPMNALGGAMTSFTAQNLGAGQYDRIRRGTLQALGMVSILAILAAGTGLLLTRGDFCYHVFLSADKVTPDAVRYGNSLLYVDFSMYLFLGFVFVVRNCVQGIGRSGFVLGAGAAELVARITVCLVLPGLFAGGAVSADAPAMAFYALCAADPMAWIAADTVLCIPFFRNILKKNYGYLRSNRA